MVVSGLGPVIAALLDFGVLLGLLLAVFIISVVKRL